MFLGQDFGNLLDFSLNNLKTLHKEVHVDVDVDVCGVRCVVCGVRCVMYGVLSVICGLWCLVCARVCKDGHACIEGGGVDSTTPSTLSRGRGPDVV